MEYLRLLKGHVTDRCIITDVGSVKTDIPGSDRPRHGGAVYRRDIRWQAREDRFCQCQGIFVEKMLTIFSTPTARPIRGVKRLGELVASLGAIPMVLDYEQHDYATAAISHLPHIIAYSLVNLVKSCDDCEGTMKTIAAGGFKDITRIASLLPRHVGKYLSFSNQEQILRLIDSFTQLGSLVTCALSPLPTAKR